LVLSPTGSINFGFTTEGRLAAVLIKTFSWGFQLGGYIYITPTSTPHHQQVLWRRCRGTKNMKKVSRQLCASKTSTSFLAPLPGRKKISTRGVSRFQSFEEVATVAYALMDGIFEFETEPKEWIYYHAYNNVANRIV
jgi:hypothetical protein